MAMPAVPQAHRRSASDAGPPPFLSLRDWIGASSGSLHSEITSSILAGRDPPVASTAAAGTREATASASTDSHTNCSHDDARSSPPCPLPRMVAATVPKSPDRPAGLTLQWKDKLSASLTSSKSPTKAAAADKGTPKGTATTPEKGIPQTLADKLWRQSQGTTAGGGVVVASVAPHSPFHPTNVLRPRDALHPGDEVLTINGHRVKDPKRAAQMIRAAGNSGFVRAVVSRGERPEGTMYHLARVDGDGDTKNRGSRWKETKEGEGNSTNCGLEFENFNHDALVRVKAVGKHSPFAKTGLRAGDVVLSIDGHPVRSSQEAGEILNDHGRDNTNSHDGSRVVALLVYSLWDMRRRVVREKLSPEDKAELKEEGGMDKMDKIRQLWQVTWSYEQTNAEGEYVVLRIPNTTVTFRLDFDADGTCACRTPFAALTSVEEKHAAELHNTSSNRGEADSQTTASNLSIDEARAALELLYRMHIAPLVDALNHRTWNRVRLLADAVASGGGEGDAASSAAASGAAAAPAAAAARPMARPHATARRRSLDRRTTSDLTVDNGPQCHQMNPQAGEECSPPTATSHPTAAAEPPGQSPGATLPAAAAEPPGARLGGETSYHIRSLPAEHRPAGRGRQALPPRPGASAPNPSRSAQRPSRHSRSPQRPSGSLPRPSRHSRSPQRPRRSPPPMEGTSRRRPDQSPRKSDFASGPKRTTPPPPHRGHEQASSSSDGSSSSEGRGPLEQPSSSWATEGPQGRPAQPYPRRASSPRSHKGMDPASSSDDNKSSSRQRGPEPMAGSDGGGDGFEERLGAAHMNPIPPRKKASEVQGVARKHGEYDSNPDWANPRVLNSSMAPVAEGSDMPLAPTPNANVPDPNAYGRRKPGRLMRRPSIVPVFAKKRRSAGTVTSALTDSDSSASGTSTTSSEYSSSSYDSDSSEESVEELPRPKKEAHHAPRHRQQRRDTAPPARSTDLVVFSPDASGQGRRKSAPPVKPQQHHKSHRLKMRNADIRHRYKVLPKVLGEGAFGTVRACFHRGTHEKLAVKSILKRGNVKNATLLKNEIALVQRVNHPNVVKVHDVIQDREYIHIVMEECRGGDLFDKIVDGGVRLSESRTCEIIGSLLDAVAYLHDRDIVHRDLKAEHIMLSSDDINSPVKIIDFGLATTHGPSDPPMTAFAGSAFTVAPEVIRRKYGKECDCWSVGVITYFLLTQKMPFNAKSDNEIFQKIVSGDYVYPQWTETGLSEDAKDFIDRLLVVDPRRRLTARQAMSHRWIRTYNQARLASSFNSMELALVPVASPQDQAIVVRAPPEQSRNERGYVRHERQRPREDATRPNPRRNNRRSPQPTGAGVASRRLRAGRAA